MASDTTSGAPWITKPLIVRSAYRSPEHNRFVGGATRSKHMDGAAFDIAMTNHDPVVFEAAARELGFLGFGFYPRSGFIHVDLGPACQWGARRRLLEAGGVAACPRVLDYRQVFQTLARASLPRLWSGSAVLKRLISPQFGKAQFRFQKAKLGRFRFHPSWSN